MKLSAASRRRAALSETVGAMLSITITIAAGAAVFGYVRTQAATSELAYANNVATGNNFLNENFKVLDVNFPAANQITFWVYNTGSVNLGISQVKVYDTGNRISVIYNYTTSGSTKTDYVYDLKGTSTICKKTASSYESPTLSSTSTSLTNAAVFTLTVPPTLSGCPSYVGTSAFTSGDTYIVVAAGLYGNSVTYYQSK